MSRNLQVEAVNISDALVAHQDWRVVGGNAQPASAALYHSSQIERMFQPAASNIDLEPPTCTSQTWSVTRDKCQNQLFLDHEIVSSSISSKQ